MSDPLLNVMKIMLLAGLYLFFIRVLWSVYNELSDPRTRVARRAESAAAVGVSPAPAMAGGAAAPATVAPATTTTTRRGRKSGATRRAGRRGPDLAPVRAVGTATPDRVERLVIVAPAPLAGRSYSVAQDLLIGRSPDCGIALDDTYVSQHHARVFTHGSDVYVEDLGSRNGSLLNEAPLHDAQAVSRGDQLRLGASVMEFA